MDKPQPGKPEVKTRDSLRAGSGQGTTRLLRSATALRVTLPQRCGSGGWYGRKVLFRPVNTAQNPLSPRKQGVSRIGTERSRARSGPLTARTDLESGIVRDEGKEGNKPGSKGAAMPSNI